MVISSWLGGFKVVIDKAAQNIAADSRPFLILLHRHRDIPFSSITAVRVVSEEHRTSDPPGSTYEVFQVCLYLRGEKVTIPGAGNYKKTRRLAEEIGNFIEKYSPRPGSFRPRGPGFARTTNE